MFWEWCEDGLQARCAPPPRFPEAMGYAINARPHTQIQNPVCFFKNEPSNCKQPQVWTARGSVKQE